MYTRTLALVLTLSPAAQTGEGMGAPYRALSFIRETVELPITLASHLVLVDGVYVNGEGPFRFLLDTGAQGGGRVDASLVERLGLEPAGEVMGGDGTGRAGRAMSLYELESIEFGGLRAEGVRVLSRDDNLHGAAARGPIDGILGIDLFDEVLLTIDYPHSVLRLEQGSLPEPDGREILPLVGENGIPAVTMKLDGKRHDAYLDSGAMGPLSVPSNLEESLSLIGAPQVVGQARTVSGSFEIRSATLDGSFTIGRHTTHQPRVVFADPLGDVIIGSEVLSEYALTLDQENERVRFWRGGWPAHESAPAKTTMNVPSQRVPLHDELGRPVIEAWIAGEGPFRFILDTGAGISVLHGDLARRLGLEVTGQTTLGIPGGEQRTPANVHVISEIVVGDAVFESVPANSWDEQAIIGAIGDVQGILGLPLFHDLLVTFDNAAGELELSHGSLGTDALPYTLDDAGLPEFQIDVAGHAIPAHFDTGNPSHLTVPASYVKELPLASEPRVIGRGRTASGDFEIRGAALDGVVDVAGLKLENPMLHITDMNQYANVGGATVRGRELTFDQRSRRLQLGGEAREAASGSVSPDASGGPQRVIRQGAPGQRGSYGVMPAITPTGPIPLRGVVPDSIAERAGLKTGDVVVALNGVDVGELDMGQRMAAFRGSPLRLTVTRDGERLEFEMTRDQDR